MHGMGMHRDGICMGVGMIGVGMYGSGVYTRVRYVRGIYLWDGVCTEVGHA